MHGVMRQPDYRELAKPMADAAENNSTLIRNRLVDKAWTELSCIELHLAI